VTIGVSGKIGIAAWIARLQTYVAFVIEVVPRPGDPRVVELARPLGISPPATFRHLKVLEDALIIPNGQLAKHGRRRI
jgi:DNA-binding transcriptional ArsR family regulator